MIPVPKFPELDGLEGEEREEAVKNIIRGSFVIGLSDITMGAQNGYQLDRSCDVCRESIEDHNACRWKACKKQGDVF